MYKGILLFFLISLAACSTMELNTNYDGKKLRKVVAVGASDIRDEKWAEMMSVSLINAGFNVVGQDYLIEELAGKGYDLSQILVEGNFSLLYYLVGIEAVFVLQTDELDLIIKLIDAENEEVIAARCCTSATANLNTMARKLAEKLL